MNTTARFGTTWVCWMIGAASLPAAACSGDSKDEGALFSARLVGDIVVLDAAKADLHYLTCSGEPTLQKRVGDEWVGLRDDRPPSANSPGYFLDDQYFWPRMNLGCDVIACRPLGGTRDVDRAVEYVKVGTRAKPAYAPADAPSPVDVFERRPIAGSLRVRVAYSNSSECATTTEVFVEFTVPEQGVCCPIGNAECSSEGPGGGWAPTLDACPEWIGGYDIAYQVVNDPHGCPTLDYDDAICCGCIPSDNDAGI